MRTTLFKCICAGIFILGKTQYCAGQVHSDNLEAGINAGIFIYQGDLTPQRLGSFKTPGLQMNFFLTRILSNSFSFRLNLDVGMLKGDESLYSSPAYRQQRNFRFKSHVTEWSGLFVWDILGRNYDERKRSGLRPYLLAGPGLNFIYVRRDWSRFNAQYFAATDLPEELNVDEKYPLPKTLFVIPTGAGLRYSLSQKISIHAETIYRFTFSDYIDGFSQAANPKKNDHYQSYSVGLIYSFGRENRLSCPRVGN